MSGLHSNISVFVPHIGCPNMCSFCNQRYITSTDKPPDESDIINAVNVAVKSKNYNPKTTELAFFGGSFTAIDRSFMLSLLKCGCEFVKNGAVSGIRVSTRPDAIDNEILSILKKYGVTSVELGAQSLNDEVLRANNRGHTAADVYLASKLIKESGFSLGLQMMTGLYRDSDELDIETAQKIVEIKPDTVRIYPTIVLKDTDLAALYTAGKYKPQTLEEAKKLCSKLYMIFKENNIKVIRLGLHSIKADSYVAGPWHPAFSEMCQSEIFLKGALSLLKQKGDYILRVAPSAVSKMTGQAKCNLIYLEKIGYGCKVCADSSLKDFEINAERR